MLSERQPPSATIAPAARIPVVVLAGFASLVPLATVPGSYDIVAVPRLALTIVTAGLVLLSVAAGSRLLPVSRQDLMLGALSLLWLSAVAVSDLRGVDPVGGLLGEYQRYQGLGPSAVYILLGGGAMVSVRLAGVRPVVAGIFAGAVLSALYVAVDALGFGWVTWQSGATDRALGLFGQPNVLAVELVCGGMAGLGLLAANPSRGRDPITIGLAAVAAVLILTFSKAGAVAAVAGLVTLFALGVHLARIPSRAAAGILAASAVTGLVVQFAAGSGVLLPGRAGAFEPAGESTRMGLWSTGAEMFLDRPAIGSGPDSFPIRFGEYRGEHQPGIGVDAVRAESSHSLILDHLVDTGVVGTSLYVALAAAVVIPAVRTVRRTPSPLTAGLLAALAAYFAATAFSFAESMTGWIPWVLLGALAGGTWGAHAGRSVNIATRAGISLVGAVLLVAGSAIFIADLIAGEADSRLQSGVPGAASRAGRAGWLNPLSPLYRELEAQALLQEGQAGEAQKVLARRNDLFAPSALSLVAQAEATHASDPSRAGSNRAFVLLLEAGRLDPFNQVRDDRALALLRLMFGDAIGPTGAPK